LTYVLESDRSKQKRLEQEQVKSGFTDLILGIAFPLSTTTEKVVQAALGVCRTDKKYGKMLPLILT